MTTQPHPTHLDARDPGKPRSLSIREEVDREIEAYDDLAALVLLAPDDRWDEFLRQTGCDDDGGEVHYRGVIVRKAAISAVVAQEGF
jgi:hypothetical protein